MSGFDDFVFCCDVSWDPIEPESPYCEMTDLNLAEAVMWVVVYE